MNRRILLSALAFLMISTFFSCTRTEDVEASTDFAMLRGGKWNVERVVNESYSNGTLVDVRVTPFGPHTDAGICTFHFEDATTFRMHDNGNEMVFTYKTDDRYIDLDDGTQFGVRKLDDENLELVIYSLQSWNPCDYSDGTTVFILSRMAE